MSSRREFVEYAALLAAGVVIPPRERWNRVASPDEHAQQRGFLDLIRAPDRVVVQTLVGMTSGEQTLRHDGNGRWRGENGVVVTTAPRAAPPARSPRLLHVTLQSPAVAVRRVGLRWRGSMADARWILGDAWERGYGDLEWRGPVADRAMPWYFATNDGASGNGRTNAYGVRTGANALCFWQCDAGGISLWADVRSGAAGVALGERTLDVCDVLCRAGREGESAFAAAHAFCREMCPNPKLPSQPVYGSNDWYWAYGKNSAETVRTDARHIVELSPSGGNRPFAVIDDGWQPGRGSDKNGAGTWDRGNDKFGDMAALASEVRGIGARPGIWIRPLQAPANAPDAWRLPRDRNTLDPTVAEVRQKIASDIARIHGWGYELVKHDYTTFDLFGRWGFQMGTALTRDGWTFASGSSRTTAEVINELYSTIRDAAGDSLVIGCNTVSHLSAGQFAICRTGDDTSGTEWARTRKMGVNTLAFRAPQHGAFYVTDADCVGVTNAVPWALNRQWLDLLARSGTMLFVSLAPDALGDEQRRDLRNAFARAALPQPLAEPLDWMRTVYPERWRMMGGERTYAWTDADGAGPP